MAGGGFKASSISSNLKNTIQNLKEITGNQNEEEIYAMLKECSMEPNETAQRLLLQGNFHEVKRKKDRKKENVNSRETTDSTWRASPPGRSDRGGRVNYTPQPAASGGRISASRKENGINGTSEMLVPSPASGEPNNEESTSVVSSVNAMANGPFDVVSGGTDGTNALQTLVDDVVKQPKSLAAPWKAPTMAIGTSDAWGKSVPSSSHSLVSTNSVKLPAVYSSASDLVVMPSDESLAATAADAAVKEAPEVKSFSMQGKMGGQSQAIGKNPIADFSQHSSSSFQGGSSSKQPPSNYGSRPQQAVGQQKGPNKEWKLKVANPSNAQGSKTHAPSEEVTGSDEAVSFSHPVPTVPKEELPNATLELKKELEDLSIRDIQHVVIPSHIHVPETIRTGLSFGSFNVAFDISSDAVNDSKIVKLPRPVSMTPEVVEEVEEKAKSNQNVLSRAEEPDYVDDQQSPIDVHEDASSGDVDASSGLIPEKTELKEIPVAPQPTIVHTSPVYSFGLVPQVLVSPLAQFESSETQSHDLSRIPGFAVPQPVDPASLYGQFFQSGVDSDGRISPFTTAGISAKYGGNVAVLATQTLLSPQEGTNSLVLSTSGQTALATQAAGILPSSLPATQQAVPVFRHPAGIQIPHYPPNYIPYGHYISPFCMPPPAIHQFLSNNAFPQQSQTGSVYPGQPTAAAPGVKHSASQYKPGSNTGNIGMAGSYGPYGSSPAGYVSGSAASGGNSTSNVDVAVSPFKESNVYITGQQGGGSAVWIAAPGRDITGLPVNTFYNLPQGQHVTLTPTQGDHGTFSGAYHPRQSVTAATIHPLFQQSQAMAGAVDMGGPTPGIYQLPQHAPNNL